MRIYVEAAAFEAVIRAMDRLSLDIKAAASASSASQTGVIAAEHLKVIEARIDEVRKDIGIAQRCGLSADEPSPLFHYAD